MEDREEFASCMGVTQSTCLFASITFYSKITTFSKMARQLRLVLL